MAFAEYKASLRTVFRHNDSELRQDRMFQTTMNSRRSSFCQQLLGIVLISLTLSPSLMAREKTLNEKILRPTNSGFRLELDFPAPESESLPEGEILRLTDEGLLGIPGAPDLPLVNRLIEIPARSGVEFNLLATEWVSLGNHSLRPLQDRQHLDSELPLPWIEEQSIYSTNISWPHQWITLSDPMIQRDTRLVKLGISPFRWNPVSGELLALAHLSVQIDFIGENLLNALPTNAPASPLFHAGLQKHLISLPTEGAMESITWESALLPLNYLVMTPASALSNTRFQDWIEWKRRKGHRVTVFDNNDISWTRTSIRNRIISQYNSDTPPDYVMLIGDVDGGSYVTPTYYNSYDHYYATISGNDILADVVVGRISARSSTQLSTIFNKIIEYEQHPDLDNPDWLHRASFLTGEGHCGLSMTQLSRSIAFQLGQQHNYTDIDTAWCALSPSYVYNWYNQGISFYNYRGWVGMEGLSQNQVMSLTQGNRTPISVIFTCNSGTFADPFYEPSYSEAFLRAGLPTMPGGGAAAMGLCTQYTHTAYNNQVCGGFWSATLDYGIRQVGTAMFRGKYELFMNLPSGDENIVDFSNWANLMGDPGMNMWVGEPGVLQFSNLPETLASDASMLEFRVTDSFGTPVENAAVCLYQSNGMQLTTLSNSLGNVLFSLDGLSSSLDLRVTASRDDFVPALDELDVTSAGTPLLLQAALWDSGTPLTLIPDHTYNLSLQFSNQSALGLTAGQLLVAADTGTALVNPAQLSIATMEPDESASAGPFSVTLADSISDHSEIGFLLYHISSGDTIITRLTMPLSTPVVTLENLNVDGSTFGAGSSSILRLGIRNTGNTDANEILFSGSFPGSPWFRVTSTPSPLSLASGTGTEDLVLDIHTMPGTWAGQQGQLRVDWQDNANIRGHFFVPLRSGIGQHTEATTGTDFGYFAVEDTDSHPLAPTYEWVEIAPNAGGSGIPQALTDHGDEEDDAVLVTLPFVFTLYGESYTRMGICSNGFVSFGPMAHLETDFRNHLLPMGMGPEPMLAPMWDDHYLTGDAQVCTLYDSDTHTYVVEWYRMRANSSGGINTFQLLLRDPEFWPTDTGDAEFVFQYNTFDDSQSNDQDFPYCTIGIKDHSATDGITICNYNLWDPTATEFDDQPRAIRFVSQSSNIEGGGIFEERTAGLHFNLSDTESESARDTVWFHNAGEGMLSWNAQVEPLGEWPLNGLTPLSSRDQGGPDSDGYTWIDSNENGGPQFQWIDTGNDAQLVEFTHNDHPSGPFEMAFDFPFYGQQFNQLYVSPNGYVSFTDTLSLWYNAVGMPSNDAPQNAIAGWWDDLLNDEEMNNHVWLYSSSDSLIVSWVEAMHFDPADFGGPFTFQIILESNGRITIQWGDMHSENPDSDSGTIGLQGPEENVGFAIRHMSQTLDNWAVQITPPFWLQTENRSGFLGSGNDGYLTLRASNTPNGLRMPGGDYLANLRLSAFETEDMLIPIGLSIGTTAVRENSGTQPEQSSLGKAWPNPFNPVTTIPFSLASAGAVQLKLYNLQGQQVLTLIDSNNLRAGQHVVKLDASALASGVYILQMRTEDQSMSRRLMLLK